MMSNDSCAIYDVKAVHDIVQYVNKKNPQSSDFLIYDLGPEELTLLGLLYRLSKPDEAVMVVYQR